MRGTFLLCVFALATLALDGCPASSDPSVEDPVICYALMTEYRNHELVQMTISDEPCEVIGQDQNEDIFLCLCPEWSGDEPVDNPFEPYGCQPRATVYFAGKDDGMQPQTYACIYDCHVPCWQPCAGRTDENGGMSCAIGHYDEMGLAELVEVNCVSKEEAMELSGSVFPCFQRQKISALD